MDTPIKILVVEDEMLIGVFFGIPPTGKFVSVEGSTIARMQNGIIVEEQDFFDNLDLFTQMGLY